MQYIQIDIGPSALALAIGVALALALHAGAALSDRVVHDRTRRALQRVLEESEANAP